MHHSHQKYPVTISEKPPEQPHLETAKNGRNQQISCYGWCAFATAGITSLTFLLCVNLIPSRNIFPVYLSLYARLVPIIKQGNLQVYPPFLDPDGNIWSNDSYVISLSPESIQDTVNSMQKVIEEYPLTRMRPYKQCWLQNPNRRRPCFFDSTWLGDECTKDNNFGYAEVNGTFNPCILIRVEKAGTWIPIPERPEDMPMFSATNYDPNFVQVICHRKHVPEKLKYRGIKMFPEKGFSLLYFPSSSFDPKVYLAPAVAVQVTGIEKGSDVQVECVIKARNSLLLWDNGIVNINFTSNNTRNEGQ